MDSDNDGFVSSDDLTDEEEPSVHFFNLLRGKILAEVNIENWGEHGTETYKLHYYQIRGGWGRGGKGRWGIPSATNE